MRIRVHIRPIIGFAAIRAESLDGCNTIAFYVRPLGSSEQLAETYQIMSFPEDDDKETVVGVLPGNGWFEIVTEQDDVVLTWPRGAPLPGWFWTEYELADCMTIAKSLGWL